MTGKNSRINICLFCGGRGSAALIRDLLRRREVQLSLLVNAYDDGLSTGAIRDFVPGMLGPSDFRKNLSYILDFYSPSQYLLQRLFEYRFPQEFDAAAVSRFSAYVRNGDPRDLDFRLEPLFGKLEAAAKQRVLELLRVFFEYHSERAQRQSFVFSDCSLGNLIFAGAYIKCGNDFNEAARVLSELVGSRARLINVSQGECRVLVGLKADGELLESEGKLVHKQSGVPIVDTFFLAEPPDMDEWSALKDSPIADKIAWLRSREMPVEPSSAVVEALAQADIVIYGPGTQHSSLLPSYRIAREAILGSPAGIKALVVNLREDNDIQNLGVTDLVDRALFYLDDPTNTRRGITHFLYNAASDSPTAIRLDRSKLDEEGTYKGAAALPGEFENKTKPNVHNGFSLIERVLDLAARRVRGAEGLDIYLDLVGRDLALESVAEELSEISLHEGVGSVSVFLAGTRAVAAKEGALITFHETGLEGAASEARFVREWLSARSSEYLVTLTGDGEYRLRDILLAVQVLRAGNFGVLLGSRTQSRLQFRSSLRAAYGESGLMFRLSGMGAFLVSAVFALRFGVILSDPLTGLRIYQRSQLKSEFKAALTGSTTDTAVGLTKLLLACNVDIAEIPVLYRTFAGFTQPKWRFRRGLKNLLSAFV